MRARGWHENGFVASTGALFGQILDQPEGVSSANQRFFTLVGATKSGGADLRGGLGCQFWFLSTFVYLFACYGLAYKGLTNSDS